MELKALNNISCGLYIVTTHLGTRHNGCVANTLLQVTSEPPKLAITLNKKNLTCDYILQSGIFTVSAISEEANITGAVSAFGFFSGREVMHRTENDGTTTTLRRNKFADLKYQEDSLHNRYLLDGTNAFYSVRVTSALDVGTHIVFAGELIDAGILSDVPSMTYAYYHKVKNGMTPKLAPSYVPPVETPAQPTDGEAQKVKLWRCDVCGYIYNGDTPPGDNYRCPLCNADKSHFNRL